MNRISWNLEDVRVCVCVRVCACVCACVFPNSPLKHHSHFCLVSTWNLAGCDCAEKGNTFQAYHGVRGLEEPIGGQLTAQSLLPAATENKKSPLRKKISKWVIQIERREWRSEVNTLYKLASGSFYIIQVQLFHAEDAMLVYLLVMYPPKFKIHP